MTPAIYILQYDEVIYCCTDKDLGFEWNEVYWTTAIWGDNRTQGVCHYGEEYPHFLPNNWLVH